MNLEQVKQFIDANKDNEEVSNYLQGFSEVSTDDYKTLEAERDELLKYKPKTLTEEEQTLQDKQSELWQREVNLTLKEKGLEQFSSVINAKDEEGLSESITALESALGDFKVDNAYVPTDHATQDEYNTAKEKGDTQSMIKSLFGLK